MTGNWSIGVMEYWSIGLEQTGVRRRAQGVRRKTSGLAPSALSLAPFSLFSTPLPHYSIIPSFHYSIILFFEQPLLDRQSKMSVRFFRDLPAG
jgi:hypothetical protein